MEGEKTGLLEASSELPLELEEKESNNAELSADLAEKESAEKELTTSDKSNFIKGAICILLAALGFSLNQAISNYLGSTVGVFEKLVFLNLVPMAIFGFLIWKEHIPMLGGKPSLMISRCLFGLFSSVLTITASTFSSRPLFELTVLSSTSAIFSMISAALWLKEKVTKAQIIIIIVCFVGVVVTVRPSPQLFTDPFWLFALGGAAFAGVAYTIVRSLKNYAHPYAVVFCFGAVSFLGSVPMYIYELYQGAGMPTFSQFIYMMLMGVTIAFGQYFLNLGYRLADASKVSPFLYVQNVYSLIISLFIFGQTVTIFSYIGAALIIGGNYANLIVSRKKAAQ